MKSKCYGVSSLQRLKHWQLCLILPFIIHSWLIINQIRLSGPFLPISRGRISAPFPIKNSHFFSQYHVWFSQLRKIFFFFFFFFFTFFFKDNYYLWETMTHIRMILKYLCLSGMLGIIQSKITWFLPILMLSRSFFPNFGQGPFPKNYCKRPWAFQ